MMTRSFPKLCMCFFWSTLKPRPSPTRMITDAIPHTMPNIVRKVRILWARKVANAWRRISERVITVLKDVRLPALGFRRTDKRFEPEAGCRKPDPPALLQYDLIAFLQTAEDFCLGAVGDSDVDGNFVLALFTFWIRHFHRD